MRKYIIPGVGVIFCSILIYQTYTLNTIKEELANIKPEISIKIIPKFNRKLALKLLFSFLESFFSISPKTIKLKIEEIIFKNIKIIDHVLIEERLLRSCSSLSEL